MKKTLALLMLAAMLLSTGCGSNAMDGAKKDAQEAAQKVEEKANEAKDAAAAKVDEAAAKADEMKADAEAKAGEMKADAEAKAGEMKADAEAKAGEMKADVEKTAEQMKSDAEAKIGQISEGAKAMRESMGEISLNGIVPGFNIDEVKEAYGEPVKSDGEELVFENGAIVNVDTNNEVKSIRLTKPDVATPKGVAVGMSEMSLNDAYGAADEVRKIADGAEYEYHLGKDKVSKLIFTARNGVISEIDSEFNK